MLRNHKAWYWLTDAQMAARLGVSQARWLAVKNGEYAISLAFAHQCARIPEFREAARYVLLPALP